MGLTLELDRLVKSYNGNPVLQECSYTFTDGLTYALLGENGSGKSTLFRVAALLEPPDAGTIKYWDNGHNLAPSLDLRRRFTLLLPQIGVFNTSVFKNAAYGLKIRGRGARDIEARVRQALETVGLAHKERQQARDLSSGETKRLGIARALVTDPQVFFLDEPTANIDPENARIIEKIILGMKTEGKSTIIMITHDPAQAERVADHLLLMKGGKIVDL
jgi:tungstate transport system ATP-binding protein